MSFDQALALHQQGRLAEAESLYTQILKMQPAHFDALHLLGLIRLQTGKTQAGIALIQKALALNPRHAAAHYNLAIGACQLGRYADAIAGFDRALALKPDYAEAHNDRGNALAALKRNEEAVTSFRRAIALAPAYAEAHNNLGIALHDLGRHEDAVAGFSRAIALRKDYAEAHNNRGAALDSLKRHEEAIPDYDRALALIPGYAAAHYNRATTLHALKRYDEALAGYDRAIALQPDYAAAHVHRGITLGALKRHDEAIASYDRAIALKPDLGEAHSNRGEALFHTGRFSESARSHATAFRISPRGKQVLGSMIHALQHACAWDELEPYRKHIVGNSEPGTTFSPFAALAAFDEPAAQLHCATAYCRLECPPRETLARPGRGPARRRLTVAYVSGDFHDHATARLAAGLFERHRREAFEIIGISIGPQSGDAMRRRLVSSFEKFLDCRSDSDRAIAETLAQHGVDIAVDLKGYTGDSRPEIFSYRPAPVQVSYLGFPGTLGAPYIDYILGDPVVTPFDHQNFYSEKIVQLPDSYQVNDHQRVIAEAAPSRRELGLPEDGFVFCCFNSHYKIMPEIFDIWMRLLKQVEGSVLWLFRGNPEAEANLKKEAARRGIAPERLVFASRLEPPQHLARHRRADLFLDTLPYNAHTTASDALWAGLPVVTCIGKAFAGRVAASLLTAIGLPELVTGSLADYEALALRLATDPAELAAMKARLAVNRLTAPLFDTDRFTRHIESAYQTMHERQQRGLPPEGFVVRKISR